jgi:hypothetical protein
VAGVSFEMVIAAGFAVAALYLWLRRGDRKSAELEMLALFDLPSDFRVVGADMGQAQKPIYLRADGLMGGPDALFHSSSRNHWVVGEYKSRRYNGRIKPYERYQVILYTGMVRRSKRTSNVNGALRYTDKLVPVPFDDELYRRLVGLIPEFQVATKKWKAPDNRPLHQR